MAIGVAAALAAALCWTLASGLWRRLPTSLGPAELNLLKNLIALALQLPLLLGSAQALPLGPTGLLLLSGVLGIALGDSFYFAALRRLGTRRTLTFDAGGPAVTAAAGCLLLAEWPGPRQWLGIALISLAVVVVARQRPMAEAGGGLEAHQRLGVVLALAALLCGGAGALLARAALRTSGLDPWHAATLRLLAATLVLLPLLGRLMTHLRRPRPRPPGRRWLLVLAATLLGTSAGIGLQQLALARLPGGLAVALLATAPVMAVPLAPLEGDRPGAPGVLAALLAVLGVVLVALP
ncbi:EamA family transporter [Cyanobium sp. Alchichica 3B3-8F6]|uniref:EamA family transporter n=1 Tax=Cyanobium sp. Alchichica 3B3-8F6 TaxID=2823696 RepID=UPI0020CEC8A8|nr:EamA family transporter [Cyanobium sp. Alchichica 3B3-8F6]MCP9882902.1 EamA family transporter [Cyanobium sp. Alchichica 3B3-8F6]